MRRHLTITLLLCISIACSYGQTRIIDSLKQRVLLANNEAEQLNEILALCEEHRSLNRDTLEYYANKARQLAAKSNDKKAKTLAELAIANTHFRWGWKDSALIILEPVLKNNPVDNPATRELHFKMARQKALYYGGALQYPEALAVLYQLVNDAEKYRDTLTLAANMNTIGSIALQRAAPRVALSWFSRAMSYSTGDDRFRPVRAAVYGNMADAYTQLDKLDSAEYFIGQSISLFRQVQNLSNLAHTLQRQSAIYIKAKQLNKAEASLKEMIEVRRQTNDGNMWMDDNLALIDFYIETNQVDKAISFCKEALSSGSLYETSGQGKFYANNINMRVGYYEALARCYKVAGQLNLYQETLEKIIGAKDSFYLANSAEALAEVQTKYEVQKKENTIIQQKLDINRKNNLFYLTVGILLFVGVVSLLLFISYRKREKLKVQLMLEKEKDSSIKAVAQAEENERKRIAADLHDNLGAYAASIASNLDFIRTESKNEQETVAMQELHSNSQAMVSQLGDTIWALNKDALTLTAISDRLKVFIRRIRPSYPQIDIELREEIGQDFSLPPTQAFHLFRIVQEAIVNAVKHSAASAVIIRIISDTSWLITVTDNGKGMSGERTNLTTGGNGLLNMKSRALVSGWQVEWEANIPSGIRVIIEPTTN